MDNDMALMLGEMRGDLKSLLRTQKELNDKLAVLATRVDNNEKSVTKIKTIAAFLGTLAGLFAGKGWDFVTAVAGTLGA